MKFNLNIHSFKHLLKSLLGRIEHVSGGLNYSPEELIVVNYHSTPKKFISDLNQQLDFYKQHFNIIKPSEIEAYYSGTLKSAKCNLLLTFDDGLKNNLYAAQVLNNQGIKAFFFIVPGFINETSEKQKDFYLKNIRPEVNPAIDSKPEDFMPMSWEDIKQLIISGHEIGSHTYTHTLSLKATDELNSSKEIVESKRQIEESLNYSITSFCSINNSLESVGSYEKKLIEEHYKYHFTTLPGLNTENKNPLFIKRRNIEVFWLRGALFYALGKADLKRWKLKCDLYNRL